MQGFVTEQGSGRRASRVQVYGVDDRFWRFHGVDGRSGPANREAFLSRALAADIGAAEGGTVLVRVERPSAIPIESLHGQKEDPGRTLRLTVRAVLDARQMGDFSIRPQQGDVRAVFVPLARLQQDLEQKRTGQRAARRRTAARRAAEAFQTLLKRHARFEDFGLSLRTLEDRAGDRARDRRGTHRSSARGRGRAGRRRRPGREARPVLTYLANTMRSGDRSVPYSLVTAMNAAGDRPGAGSVRAPRPLRRLGARPFRRRS